MDKEAENLALVRLEHAEQCIKSAKKLIEIEDYKGAANRSYYAIFHSMRSVLALSRKDFSKHSGVSSYFRKNYIKNMVFPVEMSDIISEAFEIRSNSDYDDYYVVSKKSVLEQIGHAEIFYSEIKKYVGKVINTEFVQ